jgi:hypothetical protein
VIVARGAVEVAHGGRNVILAGHYIDVSHDGIPPEEEDREPYGSLLMSGSVLHVGFQQGTICYGFQGVIGGGPGTILLNSPDLEVWRKEHVIRVLEVPLKLAPAARRNPLEGRFRIVEIGRPNDAGEGAFVRLELGGRELVARPGEAFVDPDKKPIPELAGWKLSFVGPFFALFSDGRQDASFYDVKGR